MAVQLKHAKYSSVRKERNFNCELILERYIYLRNTLKQTTENHKIC